MLARIRKSMEEKDQGFTLIELLVVMIIIGILAAIAIPVFLNQRAKARLTAAKSDASTIGKEMAAYYVDGTSTLTVSTTGTTWSAVSGGSAVTSGKLSGADFANGQGTAAGQYCVVVGTGTTGDGYITVTQYGLNTNTTGGAVPTTCTPPTTAP